MGFPERTHEAASARIADLARHAVDGKLAGSQTLQRPAACEAVRSTCIGDWPKTAVNRATNADRLRALVRANVRSEWGAPGRATISANARAIGGSARIENRSTHRLIELNERRRSLTSTCFNRADVIAPVPTSWAHQFSHRQFQRLIQPIVRIKLFDDGSGERAEQVVEAPSDDVKVATNQHDLRVAVTRDELSNLIRSRRRPRLIHDLPWRSRAVYWTGPQSAAAPPEARSPGCAPRRSIAGRAPMTSRPAPPRL